MVLGDYVITAMHEKLLRVLDVSDPASPREAQLIHVPTWAYDVDVVGDFAFVAAREGGLLVYRASDSFRGVDDRLFLPLSIRRVPGHRGAAAGSQQFGTKAVTLGDM